MRANFKAAIVLGLSALLPNEQALAQGNTGRPGSGASNTPAIGRYANVGGLRMYYEIHGTGRPLVLLHGGASTIKSTFSRILPALASSRRVIAIELQAHGHTRDIDRALSFERDADDVAELLRQLRIANADFMGVSNGGTTLFYLALRHPALVGKLVIASAIYRRDGMQPGFFDGFQNATVNDLPKCLQDAYLEANPDPKGLKAMFDRDVVRMVQFKDIDDASLRRIQAPTLVLNGNNEIVRVEHAVAVARALPNAKLAILPGRHSEYIGATCAMTKPSRVPDLAVVVIREFLDEK